MYQYYQRDFPALYEEAEHLADANPDSDQVVVVQTSKGNHYHYVNRIKNGDMTEEGAVEDVFLDMLRERDDCALDLMVCLWTETREVDQPCMRMKKKLMALYPANGDMLLLLMGEPGLICRDLKRLF